jgi:AcrR family transcriptional regulator
MSERSTGDIPRRADVLDAAWRTFTRYGYRKTSMDDVAAEAEISRPGLYFQRNGRSTMTLLPPNTR